MLMQGVGAADVLMRPTPSNEPWHLSHTSALCSVAMYSAVPQCSTEQYRLVGMRMSHPAAAHTPAAVI